MTTKQQLKLGDAVAKIAKILRIPHCEKCEERRLILNEIKTLGIRETIKRLKSVGFSVGGKTNVPRGAVDEAWPIGKIIKEMEDCCGKK